MLGEPGIEVRVDALGKGDEFGVLVDDETYEGYEIGEDALAADASDLGFPPSGVGEWFAEFWVVQRFDGTLHDVAALRFAFVRLRRGFPGFAALNPGYIDPVRVEGLEDAVGQVFDAEAAAGGTNSFVVVGADAVFHAGESVLPNATACRSFSKLTVSRCSMGRVVGTTERRLEAAHSRAVGALSLWASLPAVRIAWSAECGSWSTSSLACFFCGGAIAP